MLSDDQRHPIILSPDSHFTHLVVMAQHRRMLHGETQLTLACLCRCYWVLRSRQMVKRHIHRCLPCVRWRAANPRPVMGSLSRARVTLSRPFTHTGVDFAGPILLRTARGRGRKAYKAFVAVFISAHEPFIWRSSATTVLTLSSRPFVALCPAEACVRPCTATAAPTSWALTVNCAPCSRLPARTAAESLTSWPSRECSDTLTPRRPLTSAISGRRSRP